VREILEVDGRRCKGKGKGEEEGEREGEEKGEEEEELVMELFNLLVRPQSINDDDDSGGGGGGEPFELRWHRDGIPDDVSSDEEARKLFGRDTASGGRMLHAQWNLALFDDESLIVVPGSHARIRTEEERAADPFEKEMPGQMLVKLKAGDAVFYDNNILHRGAYRADMQRLTLHGSMGVKAEDGDRASNVLQHGVGEWVGRCDFSGLRGEIGGRKVSEVAEGMRLALIEMGKRGHDGFVLDG